RVLRVYAMLTLHKHKDITVARRVTTAHEPDAFPHPTVLLCKEVRRFFIILVCGKPGFPVVDAAAAVCLHHDARSTIVSGPEVLCFDCLSHVVFSLCCLLLRLLF